MAVSVPSCLAPIFSFWCESGRLETMCSCRRSSIRRTGALALRERLAATTPSLPAPNFAPKPPPMNSVMTRTLLFGSLKTSANSFAHARGALRGRVDRHLFRLPVNNEAVRFERGVRLHLRAVLAFDDDVGFGEALSGVADLFALRAVDVADLGHTFGSAAATRASGRICRSGEDHGSVFLARVSAIHDKRHRVVLHLDQRSRIIGD